LTAAVAEFTAAIDRRIVLGSLPAPRGGPRLQGV
jgi:hypothetical protein